MRNIVSGSGRSVDGKTTIYLEIRNRVEDLKDCFDFHISEKVVVFRGAHKDELITPMASSVPCHIPGFYPQSAEKVRIPQN